MLFIAFYVSGEISSRQEESYKAHDGVCPTEGEEGSEGEQTPSGCHKVLASPEYTLIYFVVIAFVTHVFKEPDFLATFQDLAPIPESHKNSARNILDCPEIEGTHGDDQDVAQRFIIIEQAKEHVEDQSQSLEQQVEEADRGVRRILDELR